MLENDRLHFCDLLRGWASILVVLSHFIGVFWVSQKGLSRRMGYDPVVDVNLPMASFFIDNRVFFGQLGVSLFFILSGFVISLSLSKHNKLGFLLNRVIRIYPVYIIGFLVAVFGLHLVDFKGDGIPYEMNHIIVHMMIVIRQWFDLLYFNNMSWVKIDGISWTLEIELYFYLVIFCIFQLNEKYRIAAVILTMILFIYLALYLVQSNWYISRQFSVIGYMFVGYFLYLLLVGRIKLPYLCLIIFTEAIGLYWVFSQIRPFTSDVVNWYLPYLLSPLVFLVFLIYRVEYKIDRISSFLSKISYPLYVMHSVFGYAIMVRLLRMGVGSWVAVFLALLSVIIISYIIHLFIEVPSIKYGRRFKH